MRAFLECLPCILNQIIKVLKKNVKSQKRREKILSLILAELSIKPLSITPPDLTHEAYNILRKYAGNKDFFATEKT
ncbi:ARMT1-like domain-containing protein, partial [Candidatus Margulisiibacteriota bacterium]